ncbi:MAG: hypothetical protein ABIJ41_05495 [Candidatus Omnitrophota bacterium]
MPIKLKRVLFYSILTFFILLNVYLLVLAKNPLLFDPALKVKQTQHFNIYYKKDSPAQCDIEQLSRLLESYYKETTDLFEISLNNKIDYFFHDKQIIHARRGIPIWGYATSVSVHSVYRDSMKDSSPHELCHFIQGMVNPNAPYFFNEGICGYQIQIGGEGFNEKIRRIHPDLDQFSLPVLVDDFQRYGRLGDFLAYSFNAFLVDAYGKEKLPVFYKRVTKDNWKSLMLEIFLESYEQIERDWKEFLL